MERRVNAKKDRERNIYIDAAFYIIVVVGVS